MPILHQHQTFVLVREYGTWFLECIPPSHNSNHNVEENDPSLSLWNTVLSHSSLSSTTFEEEEEMEKNDNESSNTVPPPQPQQRRRMAQIMEGQDILEQFVTVQDDPSLALTFHILSIERV
jgi:hypothetical protein